MINEQYNLWCEKATIDADLVAELKAIEGPEEAISDIQQVSNASKVVRIDDNHLKVIYHLHIWD